MAVGRRNKQGGQEQEQLYEATTSIACDLSDGTPVVIRAGEVFEESHELVRRYKDAYFVEVGKPSWEKTRIQQQRDARMARRG